MQQMSNRKPRDRTGLMTPRFNTCAGRLRTKRVPAQLQAVQQNRRTAAQSLRMPCAARLWWMALAAEYAAHGLGDTAGGGGRVLIHFQS